MSARLDIISPLPPYPAQAGGTAHILGAALALRDHYRVRLWALAADPATVRWGPLVTLDAVAAFARDGGENVTTKKRRNEGHKGRELRLSESGGWPDLLPPGVRQERSVALTADLRRVWATTPPQIVQLEFTSMAQYAPLARQFGARVVCTAHNIAFLAQVRRAQRERGPLALRRWAGALSLLLYERRALRQCDLVVVHGPADAAAARRWLPGVRVAYVPSGINLPPAPVSPANTETVLFVGNYSHPPNLEGARWLAERVWPLVLARRPRARLVLAGRAPPPELLALAAPTVEIPGALPDLTPLYARSAVAAAPIFWGSGVRVKILEAMAHSLPLVATPLAAEGIALTDAALLAQTPQAFADALLTLLADAALRRRLGAAGRALVSHDHCWEVIGQQLAALYNSLGERIHR